MDRWLPKIVIAGAIAILIFSSILVPRLRSANPQDRDVLIQVLGGTADFAAEEAFHEAEVYFHAGFDTECPDEQTDHHVHREVKASE
ncbi:MAG TPA: hypothetical protein VFI02_16975, partial [Armatimonadota bacterium]|nr:hypothetical protein [Armatimonadota bacterium]